MPSLTIAPGANAPVPAAPVAPDNVALNADGSVSATPAATPTPPAVDPNRPAWLPEKFKDPEAMAKSYAELEAKLGTPPKVEDPPAPAPNPSGIDFPALEAEYAKDGALSKDSLAKLKAVGITEADVALYAEGRVAAGNKLNDAVAAVAGGVPQMQSVLEWAVANLPTAEQDAYNAAVDSGDVTRSTQAFAGVMAKYAVANPTEPALISADNPSTTVPMYKAWAEVTADMANPKYPKDAAFRSRVAARLAASDSTRFTY